MYRREAIYADHELSFALNSYSPDGIMTAGFYSKLKKLKN